MTILRTEIFNLNDSYFTNEVFTEFINTYIQESGRIFLKIDNKCEEEIKNYIKSKNSDNIAANNSNSSNINNLELDEFSLNNLRDYNFLTKEDWIKINEIMSKIENCNDPYILKIFAKMLENDDEYQKKLEKTAKKQQNQVVNTNIISYEALKGIYENLMKAFINIYEKGTDKIIIEFAKRNETFFENHYKKKAFMSIVPNEDLNQILDLVEYARDKKSKKLKCPVIELDARIAKNFISTTTLISPINNVDYGYSVLIEDMYAEFFIHLKFLENFLRVIFNKYDPEIDCKMVHIRYFDLLKNITVFMKDIIKIKDNILSFDMNYYEVEENHDMSNIQDN